MLQFLARFNQLFLIFYWFFYLFVPLCPNYLSFWPYFCLPGFMSFKSLWQWLPMLLPFSNNPTTQNQSVSNFEVLSCVGHVNDSCFQYFFQFFFLFCSFYGVFPDHFFLFFINSILANSICNQCFLSSPFTF